MAAITKKIESLLDELEQGLKKQTRLQAKCLDHQKINQNEKKSLQLERDFLRKSKLFFEQGEQCILKKESLQLVELEEQQGKSDQLFNSLQQEIVNLESKLSEIQCLHTTLKINGQDNTLFTKIIDFFKEILSYLGVTLTRSTQKIIDDTLAQCESLHASFFKSHNDFSEEPPFVVEPRYFNR